MLNRMIVFASVKILQLPRENPFCRMLLLPRLRVKYFLSFVSNFPITPNFRKPMLPPSSIDFHSINRAETLHQHLKMNCLQLSVVVGSENFGNLMK
jgi:hypothetical protein